MVSALALGISIVAFLLPADEPALPQGLIDPARISASVIDHCGKDFESRRQRAHFEEGLDSLRQAMGEYRALRDRMVARPTRAPVKGLPDPHIKEREEIAGAAFEVQLALRDLLPIEDYPLAVLGADRMLREGDIPSPTGHGREHLTLQTAFILGLLELVPESGRLGGDFIDPLNESYSMTSIDLRQMQSRHANHDEIMAEMDKAIDRFPGFEGALRRFLEHHNFNHSTAKFAVKLCSERQRDN